MRAGEPNKTEMHHIIPDGPWDCPVREFFNPFLFNILIIIAPKKIYGLDPFGRASVAPLARPNNVVTPHALARQHPPR
jgi:hypothetical protein